MHVLPETGYLRLSQIIGNPKTEPPIPAIIPVSKSTWWAGVKSGRFPQPVRTLGMRITAWRVEDIRVLIHETSNHGRNS
jgi:prophage regulatory protein